MEKGKKKKENTFWGNGKNEGSTYLERTEERFVHVHHGTCVVKLAAIVGRREDRDELTIREELITILDDLLKHRRTPKVRFPR